MEAEEIIERFAAEEHKYYTLAVYLMGLAEV